MQSPIPAATVLQNRYRVAHMLGQGGFGRTYLAEDQGRFNERCVLKEFMPLQGEDHFSEKATQLFQREAQILYKIQHPQIPQFRAIFEQDQRLFLVQDYVEGMTYRELLDQRRLQQQSFSEAEVRQFLHQMLPVLAHIHAQGIIHRDISPDNIILRNSDRLPVLIDFGVVKEVVTRIQVPEVVSQATTVGKRGYAPSEQMQTGRAYPSSDLYSLAVTAIVLLTGKEPQMLFDDVNLTWVWPQYVTVSPGLAQVLNRALSYRPGDRYQSVNEMAQALGESVTTATRPASPPPPSAPEVSRMKTVAVSPRYQATQAHTAARTSPARPTTQSAPSTSESDSLWENPWAVSAIGLGLALAAALGGWAVVQAINSDDTAAPPAVESPDITLNPTPTEPTEPAPNRPVEYSQAFSLSAGESQTVEGSLRAGETVNYRFQAERASP